MKCCFRIFFAAFLSFLFCYQVAIAATNALDVYTFKNPAQAEQFHILSQQLRCLVCQNQNLADSDAPLAKDLRTEIYRMIQTGDTNQEIIHFLTARYGDFVLYQPPFKPLTWILWLAPFGLLAMVLLLWWYRVRQRTDIKLAQRPGFSQSTALPATVKKATRSGVIFSQKWLLLCILLGIVGASAIYFWRGNWQQIRAYNQAKQQTAQMQALLAEIKTPQDLIKKLKDSVIAHPNNGQGWFLLGRLYVASQQYSNAVAAFAKAYHLRPKDASVLAQYAHAMYLQNDQQMSNQARELLQQAVSIDPNTPAALNLMAMIAFHQKKYETAILHWQTLLARYPANSEEAQNLRLAITNAQRLMKGSNPSWQQASTK